MRSCGDFESAKAMIELDVGFGLLPDRVALQLVGSGKIAAVQEIQKLQHIGPHTIEYSCRKHRALDRALTWCENQLLSMLRSRV